MPVLTALFIGLAPQYCCISATIWYNYIVPYRAKEVIADEGDTDFAPVPLSLGYNGSQSKRMYFLAGGADLNGQGVVGLDSFQSLNRCRSEGASAYASGGLHTAQVLHLSRTGSAIFPSTGQLWRRTAIV